MDGADPAYKDFYYETVSISCRSMVSLPNGLREIRIPEILAGYDERTGGQVPSGPAVFRQRTAFEGGGYQPGLDAVSICIMIRLREMAESGGLYPEEQKSGDLPGWCAGY